MKRNVLLTVGVVLIVAAGALAYLRFRPGSAQAQPDPAVQIAVALGALERSDSFQLSPDQIRIILPLLRVLRDTNPDDVEASRALATAIRNALTPEQLAEIERLREQAQTRRENPRRAPGGGGPGFGPGAPGQGGPGGPGAGPGAANPQTRAELRTRARQALLSRLIRFLERRL